MSHLPDEREAGAGAGWLAGGGAGVGPHVADVEVLQQQQQHRGQGAQHQQQEGREELVDGERLRGSLLLHVGLAHPVQPVPAQPLQVPVLLVLELQTKVREDFTITEKAPTTSCGPSLPALPCTRAACR